MEEKSLEAVAMGSIYLDKGEGMEYLEAQITRMAKQNPICYFFDIICRPNQLHEVSAYITLFYSLTKSMIPNLPDDKKFIGITCDDRIRPAMIAVAVTNAHGHPTVKDINPERPGR